jgi:hypothetical protein
VQEASSRQQNDAVRQHLVRVLDWEEPHAGFDKAVAGIPRRRAHGKPNQTCLGAILLAADHVAYHVGQIDAVRRAPVCGPRARRYLAPGVVLVPGVPSCLSNSATAVSSCESLPV